MEILNIKISRFSDLISGIKLYENNSLLVIFLNPVDYVLDGVCFINKHYIKKVEPETDDELKLKILKHKFNDYNFQYESFETMKDVVSYFQKKQYKLIELSLDSSSYSIIGNVQKINEKSFILKMLSVKAKYLKDEKFEDNKIRMLAIDSDYLNSLEYYLTSSPAPSNEQMQRKHRKKK